MAAPQLLVPVTLQKPAVSQKRWPLCVLQVLLAHCAFAVQAEQKARPVPPVEPLLPVEPVLPVLVEPVLVEPVLVEPDVEPVATTGELQSQSPLPQLYRPLQSLGLWQTLADEHLPWFGSQYPLTHCEFDVQAVQTAPAPGMTAEPSQ